MTDNRSPGDRRITLVRWLGAEPGPFAVTSVVLALAWFPFRLYLDRGDPLSSIVASSGLSGAVWALIPPALDWLNRRLPLRKTSSVAEAERPAWIRRGARLGLAVGVPFHCALLVLCLSTGQSRSYPVAFGIVAAAIAAIAVIRLRSTARTAAH